MCEKRGVYDMILGYFGFKNVIRGHAQNPYAIDIF